MAFSWSGRGDGIRADVPAPLSSFPRRRESRTCVTKSLTAYEYNDYNRPKKATTEVNPLLPVTQARFNAYYGHEKELGDCPALSPHYRNCGEDDLL